MTVSNGACLSLSLHRDGRGQDSIRAFQEALTLSGEDALADFPHHGEAFVDCGWEMMGSTLWSSVRLEGWLYISKISRRKSASTSHAQAPPTAAGASRTATWPLSTWSADLAVRPHFSTPRYQGHHVIRAVTCVLPRYSST